jgi:Zn ribbon nucleic-acid-binding protein
MKKAENRPKEMSLIEFAEKYGTEEKCCEDLFEKRFCGGFLCPKCGHDHGVKIKTRMSMQCSKCGYQQSAIVGTVMHNSKMPIQKWYYSVYLLTSSKRGMSSKELQRHIKVTYKTAWYVNKRIRAAMEESDNKYSLDGIVSIDESYFSGVQNVSDKDPPKPKKRGRGTAKNKVIVAVSLSKDGHPLYAKVKVVSNFKAKTIEAFAEENITHNSQIITDGFQSYKSQKLKKDYFHKFENFDKSDNHSDLKWMHIFISNAKAFINGTLHGLNGDSLQSYLNEFCYRFNRRHIPDLVFDKLLRSMFLCKPQTYYAAGVLG